MFKKFLSLLVICGLLFGSINFCFASEKKLNPISWKTDTVQLSATDFYIVVDGKTFIPNESVMINSDPGNSKYTTLEITWFENSIEMRMNLYFAADKKTWWVSEVRVYDGNKKANWITLKKQIFKTAIKASLVGSTQGSSIKVSEKASINFKSLKLSAFIEIPKLEKEIKVPICTEKKLKKGTIVRSSNIAFPTNSKDKTKPKYETVFFSKIRYENTQIVQLKKDTWIYLTDGGFYTDKFSNTKEYLKELEKIGITRITRQEYPKK